MEFPLSVCSSFVCHFISLGVFGLLLSFAAVFAEMLQMDSTRFNFVWNIRQSVCLYVYTRYEYTVCLPFAMQLNLTFTKISCKYSYYI